MKKIIFTVMLCVLMTGCGNKTVVNDKGPEKSWEQQLDDVLPLLGHRNWVLVVDKAFPLQSAAGMTYINSQADLLPVLNVVSEKIRQASHVQAIFYTDAELKVLNEELVPGIEDFRKQLYQSLEGNNVQTLLHNDVFERLDTASKLFNVVVIKTEQVMPYTSVFIELDCGYWSADRESKMRQLMNQ